MSDAKPKKKRRSRNAEIEEQQRKALEENLKIIGPDGKEVTDFADV